MIEFVLFIAVLALAWALQRQAKTVDRLTERLDALEVTHAYRSLVRQKDEAPAVQSPRAAPVDPAGEPAIVVEPAVVVEPAPAAEHAADESSAAVEPEPADTFVAGETARRRFAMPALDFEDLFGRRLTTWLGGATLAVAGVLLVAWSIERGLLTPAVRVLLSFLFGAALLALAEAAYRLRDRVRDERVPQALAGAGLATLYAAFYLAGTQYGLIGQTLAFLGLAAVTALAIGLSYRFGLPSAVLGLVGGFAAPALVGGDEVNVPLLALYLGLVAGGLVVTANRQKRPWLGFAALAGGLGWGALFLIGQGFSVGELTAVGLYLVALGAILPAILAPDTYRGTARLAAAAATSVQLGVLVEVGGYAPLTWSLYLLLGAALAVLGWRRGELRQGSAIAASVGIVLLTRWPEPGSLALAAIALAMLVVFVGPPLWRLRQAERVTWEPYLVAALPLSISVVALRLLGDTADAALGLGIAMLAVVPAAAAAALWRREEEPALAANAGAAAFASLIGLTVALPPLAAVPLAALLVAGLTAMTLRRAQATRATGALPWLMAGTAVVLALATSRFAELDAMLHGPGAPLWGGFVRWGALAAAFAVLALAERRTGERRLAEALAAFAAAAAALQVLPPIAVVWGAALSIAALRWRTPPRLAAMLALATVAFVWAVPALGTWSQSGGAALLGEPMLLSGVPAPRALLGFILPLALGLAAAAWGRGRLLAAPALAIGLIAAHSFYKQVFAIETLTAFAARGLAERTVWEAILLAAAWLAATGAGPLAPSRRAATAIVGAMLAHFVVFTALWHNPLWDAQAVGPVPLANLVLAAYGLAIAALLSLRRWEAAPVPALDAAVMVAAILGALTLLRQMFAGSVMAGVPLSQAEDLLRSLLGIVLALAFLFVGSRMATRTWRIGSLLLMIATVVKVFVFDTAGLEGLVRIASFVALGASLIGIGWFYSRQLRPAA